MVFDQWREKLRKYVLHTLRPGRDMNELLDMIQRAEAIQSDEQRQMFERLVDFRETRVREIMIPRLQIKAVQVSASLEEVETMLVEMGVTRLPVIDEDLDRVVGKVHIWDVFSARVRGERKTLRDLLRPCLTVSELERVSSLLPEMREGSHMAIVRDEFGGTAGLITLSDLLEEIVGSMGEGAGMEESGEYSWTANGGLEVQAIMHIEDLEKLLNREFPEGDYDTVGGLVITELARIPVRGEQVTVAGVEMHIQEADPKRVIKVLIKPGQVQN